MEENALLPKTIFDQRYEILDLAGEGGMGKVYRARHQQLDRIVAIKVLRKEMVTKEEVLRRFKHEAQMAAELNHPNVANVQAFGVFEGQPYIAFEFLEGRGLDEILERGGTLDFDEFINIFQQACAGVAHAHDHGLIHRDLKPANIFLLGNEPLTDRVQILDFGIAKDIEAPTGAGQRLTETGTLLGTPLYMSPEQGRAEKVTFASDVYALGCVMFHALYGKPPFGGESAYQVLFNHSYESLVLDMVPSGYPAGILPLLEKAMDKDSTKRYANARELGDAISAIMQEPRISKSKSRKAIKTPVPAGEPIKAPRWIIPAAAMLGVAVAAGGIWPIVTGVLSPGSVSIEQQWRRSHNVIQLRSQLAQLNKSHPQDAQVVLRDLHDDLLIRPSLDTAGIFLDEAAAVNNGIASKEAGNYASDAGNIFRFLQPQEWSNPLSTELAKRWGAFRAEKPTSENQALMFCYMTNCMSDDCNQTGAIQMAALAQKTFGTSRNIDYPTAKIACEAAENILGTNDSRFALQLAQVVANSNLDTSRCLGEMTLARIYDRLGDPVSGLAHWKKAQNLAAHNPDADIDLTLKLALGAADDQAASGDKNGAGASYGRLMDQLGKLPNDATKWDMMLHAADGYVYLGRDKDAQLVFDRGLKEIRARVDSKVDENDPGKQALNSAYFGQFLGHAGQSNASLAQFVSAAHDAMEQRTPDAIMARQVIGPGFMMQSDPSKAELKLTTMKGAAKEKSAKSLYEARRLLLIAEWQDGRGYLKGAADQLAQCAQEFADAFKDDTFTTAALAARKYFEVKDYERALYWVNFAQALDSCPADQKIVLRAMAGDVAFRMGDLNGARSWYHKSVWHLSRAGSPAIIESATNCAVMEHGNGQVKDAIEDARTAWDYGSSHRIASPQVRRAGILLLRYYMDADKPEAASDFLHSFMQFTSPRSLINMSQQ